MSSVSYAVLNGSQDLPGTQRQLEPQLEKVQRDPTRPDDELKICLALRYGSAPRSSEKAPTIPSYSRVPTRERLTTHPLLRPPARAPHITMASPAPTTSSSSSPTTTTSKPSTNLYLENDPARTGFNPSTNHWITLFHALTGSITPEGLFHYRESRYRANEARDVARVSADRDWLLRWSPTILFLNDKIADLNHGQRLGPDQIRCARCPGRLTSDGRVERQSGGFEPAHGILVCANEVRNRGHLEDVLAHEMVHAYDSLRWEVDFRGQRDLRQAACTEVSFSNRPVLLPLWREAWILTGVMFNRYEHRC